jgi:hypothetical protein
MRNGAMSPLIFSTCKPSLWSWWTYFFVSVHEQNPYALRAPRKSQTTFETKKDEFTADKLWTVKYKLRQIAQTGNVLASICAGLEAIRLSNVSANNLSLAVLDFNGKLEQRYEFISALRHNPSEVSNRTLTVDEVACLQELSPSNWNNVFMHVLTHHAKDLSDEGISRFFDVLCGAPKQDRLSLGTLRYSKPAEPDCEAVTLQTAMLNVWVDKVLKTANGSRETLQKFLALAPVALRKPSELGKFDKESAAAFGADGWVGSAILEMTALQVMSTDWSCASVAQKAQAKAVLARRENFGMRFQLFVRAAGLVLVSILHWKYKPSSHPPPACGITVSTLVRKSRLVIRQCRFTILAKFIVKSTHPA